MAVNSSRIDEDQKEVFKKDTLLRLYRYLLDFKKEIVIVLFIMAGTIAISMSAPLMMEYAINSCVAKKDMTGLLWLGSGAIVLFLLFLAGTKMRMRLMADVSNRVLLNIREELYQHIQTLGFGFFDSRPTGKILARIIGDVNALKDVLSDSVTQLIPDLITVVCVAVIMLIKNYRLAMAALLTLPILAVGMFLIETTVHRRWQIYRKKTSNLNAYVHEDLSGIRIIQSFAAEPETKEVFHDLVNQHYKSFMDAVIVADGFGPLVEVTWGLGGFLLYFIGIRIVGVENIGIGTFLAFSTYIAMFWSPIRNLANFYNKLTTNISAAERIFDIIDTEAEITDQEGAEILPEVKGEVVFEHVSFAYGDEPDRLILDDVNFSVKPGETIALVGPTGAGKTTIVNLISRFYETTGGKIFVDGHEIKEVTLNSLRSQMGIMTQDNFLFSGTIRDNIKYGRLDASDTEVTEAAKAVNAHEFIMKLENGYDTVISERGAGLSIGQRQLLAFARTMVSMPGILILDEATSSIDTHTELLVQQGIDALLRGRTSFVIAHRLSTIRKADRIFVIDQGNIMEAGSHEELMELKGAYYKLYQSQFS
ncbi:ABC transporter ATP-binding protein [Lacrimispora sphenoides]|uniref:ATP-binding cassette, subfamily B n=1 Tax=Lacrimispora sphenoides JCM 1415 TaxID=1297793 RepID=A0ABY1C5A4_9FIRM|nr:ABC transporter ATP-binding protein [Lacrimispora sphenoides]SET68907.1 ATP-binding cassette, subfamily B [[Clostridium] sphenoides JCM 1415]SUY50504.1 ABC transporter [Lacrimispora sphenoides]